MSESHSPNKRGRRGKIEEPSPAKKVKPSEGIKPSKTTATEDSSEESDLQINRGHRQTNEDLDADDFIKAKDKNKVEDSESESSYEEEIEDESEFDPEEEEDEGSDWSI